MLGSSQMRLPASGCITSPHEGEKRSLNSELWHACAGPLVSLPALGTRIVYFPQGHSEQVAASTQKEVDAHIPNYPNLPPQLICQLHNVTLHADIETDEVYAQMTLQPVNAQEKEPYLVPDLATQSRQPNTFFCKTLTASDTSTHGGFSIPRRAAEKVFPPLDFTQQPPAQELIARDLHDNEWKFRHIYRGQPKRHLLTTGWSVFVSAKRLTAGDSVLFIRNEKGQLLLGIRRANRPQTVMPSSVLSSDSMHIGVLAAAAHAAATNSRFTIFYNPRASPSEFVIPLTKYEKAVCHTQVSVGMRFRMLFETEESSVRRYMGTITGIGDLDPVRWPNSRWRSIKVGWDESTTGERQRRVSLWEIEPLTTFLVYPPSSNWRLKRPWPQALGTTSPSGLEVENMKRSFMWMSGQNGDRSFHGLVPQGMGVNSWAQMQQRFDSPVQTELYDAIAAAALQETRNNDPLKQLPHVQQQQPLQPQQILFKAQSQIQQQPQHLFLHQQGQPSYSQPLPLQQPHHIQHPKQNCIFQQQTQHSLQQSQQSLLQQQQPHSSHPEQLQQQQQLFQQQPFQVPAVPAAMTRFPLLQPQISPNLSVSTHPQSNTTKPNPGLAAGRQNSFLLQNIFGSLASDDSSLHSNLMPSQTGIQQQSGIIPVSAVHQDPNLSSSWFPSSIGANPLSSGLPSELNDTTRPTGGSCILSQMDPSVLSTLSVPSLPTSAFAVRDSHQERESVNPDPHSHLLFGVNIDAPSLVISSSMSPASRSFNNGNELQSPFVGPLMQGSSIGGTDLPLSSSMLVNGSLNECGFLQQVHALTNVNHPTRTFTKVYKLGSVGRSLDVTRFNNYAELRHELARMFGLEGQLEDPQRSGWQLVYTDKESELLLVGDDPWEEFISSVRCIKILSPPEVLQMTQDGMELLSCIPAQRQTSSSSEDCPTRQSRNPSSALTSACSIDY